MKSKSDWGNCQRCGKEITNNNLGDRIEAEEILVCDSCAEKHSANVINELERFRHSDDFHNILELRKKVLWISEKMGNWGDNADKSIQENVSDYEDWSVHELQSSIVGFEITIIENAIYDDVLEEKEKKIDKKDTERDKLRKELRELLRKLHDV